MKTETGAVCWYSERRRMGIHFWWPIWTVNWICGYNKEIVNAGLSVIVTVLTKRCSVLSGVQLNDEKAEAVKGELMWTLCTLLPCHALLFSSSCLERGGRSNEIAKQDWKQRPECCYFWCWSRSGGKERRALHAAHDICCLLSPCPFAPEEVLIMYEIHHRWSEVGDRPKTLWAQLIQSEERFLLMWTFNCFT